MYLTVGVRFPGDSGNSFNSCFSFDGLVAGGLSILFLLGTFSIVCDNWCFISFIMLQILIECVFTVNTSFFCDCSCSYSFMYGNLGIGLILLGLMVMQRDIFLVLEMLSFEFRREILLMLETFMFVLILNLSGGRSHSGTRSLKYRAAIALSPFIQIGRAHV